MEYLMLRIAVITCVAGLTAVGAAAGVANLQQPAQARPADPSIAFQAPDASSARPAPVDVAQTTTSSAPGARDASITKSTDGHYWAEANVNGSAVRFLVDTGATAVSLSPEDARRLGFDPATLTYGYKVTTASGEARAAKVQLTSVSVGGARVEAVDAYVIEKGLDQSLLGMSYLGRLSTFQATPTGMILRS
jgi:aspartyl protease family protein